MHRVLIVEDDADVAKSIRQLLVSERYGVAIARNVDKALALVGEKPFDVIILDIMMPGTSVEEFVELVEDIPIIYCTALSPIEAHHRTNLAGKAVVDYLKKPYSNANLLSAVRSAIERKPSLQRHHV